MNVTVGKKVSPWAVQSSVLSYGQVAEDRLCLVRLGHVCVIVAIVLLLGDDRWERLS